MGNTSQKTKKSGKPKTRPALFDTMLEKWQRGEVTAREAAKELGIVHQTFLKWAREYGSVQCDEKKQRQLIIARQCEGRSAAKARGVKLGRKPIAIPDNFEEIKQRWLREEITGREASAMLGITHTVFTNWVGVKGLFDHNKTRQCDRRRQQEGFAAARARGVRLGKPPMERPPLFEKLKEQWSCGEISAREGARQLGIGTITFLNWVDGRHQGHEGAKARGYVYKGRQRIKKTQEMRG